MFKSRVYSHLSSPLLLAVIMLLGVGLVQVYSSSYIFATENYGDALFFFKRQAFFAAVGFFILLITAQWPAKNVEKWGWLLWFLAGIGVALTFIPGIGIRVGGAARWLQMPFGMRFEPSEVLKFCFPLLFATILMKSESVLARWNPLAILAMIVLPLFLLLRQPDFGSFTIIMITGLGMLFCFGLKWRWIISSLFVLVPAFYLLVMRVEYRRARVLAFLDPWADPEQKGFQVIQSMLSFHSGGVTGVGLGQGQGKLFFLPEAHTDFTLAVLGEEMGFVGFFLVMMLYAFIVLRGFQIGVRAEKNFQRAAALGISLVFALSIVINVGVVLGMMPTKGLTLPFLSYGGSSLIVLCFIFGVLLNIERNSLLATQNTFLRRKSKLG